MKKYIPVVLAFLVLWGVIGALNGDGFFIGIAKQFEALFYIACIVTIGLVVLLIYSNNVKTKK